MITASSLSIFRFFDANKDQSYFLYPISQTALCDSLFPVGHLTKLEVRDLAKNANLITQSKKDSTGICFVGERKFKAFLSEFLPSQPGTIQTKTGQIIGEHDGLMFYTLGQRQGLKIGGKKGFDEKPWYVTAKCLDNNVLVVSQDENDPWQMSQRLIAKEIHWITPPQSPSFKAFAKVRYRQPEQPCHVTLLEEGALLVEFKECQRAVTPGQSVVLYQDEVCLGGAIIQATDSQGGLLQTQHLFHHSLSHQEVFHGS